MVKKCASKFEKDGKSKKFKIFATSFIKKRKSVLKILKKRKKFNILR